MPARRDRHDGDLPAARRAFVSAGERQEAPQAYIDLCVGEMDRTPPPAAATGAATLPATQPR